MGHPDQRIAESKEKHQRVRHFLDRTDLDGVWLARRDNFAWYVLFRNGIALNDLKERPKHIRLVRGNRTP